MRQTLDQILMYRRFADTELRGSSTDGGFILDNVHSQITGSLFDVIPHVPDLLRCVSETVYAQRRKERSKIEIENSTQKGGKSPLFVWNLFKLGEQQISYNAIRNSWRR